MQRYTHTSFSENFDMIGTLVIKLWKKNLTVIVVSSLHLQKHENSSTENRQLICRVRWISVSLSWNKNYIFRSMTLLFFPKNITSYLSLKLSCKLWKFFEKKRNYKDSSNSANILVNNTVKLKILFLSHSDHSGKKNDYLLVGNDQNNFQFNEWLKNERERKKDSFRLVLYLQVIAKLILIFKILIHLNLCCLIKPIKMSLRLFSLII